MMNQNKTRPTEVSVIDFLDQLPLNRQSDCRQLDVMMEQLTGTKAKLWGKDILGYGQYHYRYKSGREGDWFLCGFAARKQALTLYLLCDLSHQDIDFSNLGTYKKGVGCLYLKKLADVDFNKLTDLVRTAIRLCQQQNKD